MVIKNIWTRVSILDGTLCLRSFAPQLGCSIRDAKVATFGLVCLRVQLAQTLYIFQLTIEERGATCEYTHWIHPRVKTILSQYFRALMAFAA